MGNCAIPFEGERVDSILLILTGFELKVYSGALYSSVSYSEGCLDCGSSEENEFFTIEMVT